MERFISYHIERRGTQWVIQGVDADGHETGSAVYFDDGYKALQAYIDLNGFTDLVPEDILYCLEAAS